MSINGKINKLNTTLHGARGLAAIMVVFSHIGVSGITDKFFVDIPTYLAAIKYILLSGQYGVEIFFMISGYLITASIIRHKTVSSFVLDRCIRLYPVFLPAILFIFILGPIAGYAYFSGFTWLDWLIHFIINLLFIPGVFPMKAALVVAWSLSYEAVFYLAISYFKYFKKNKKSQIAFVIFAIVPFVVLLPRAIFFIIGIFIYYLLRRDIKINVRLPKMFFINIILFLFFLFLLQFNEEVGILITSWQEALIWCLSIVLGYLVFVEIVIQSSAAVSLLKWRWMQFLGTISYSLYIWHTLILFGTKRIFANSFEVFGSYKAFLLFSIVSLALSILVSYLSYIVLEVKAAKIISAWRKSTLSE